MHKVAIVGQGPNRTAWEHGLELGIKWFGATSPNTKLKAEIFRLAERYCSKVAITGSVGSKLAVLAGLDPYTFRTSFARRNLHARWNGKIGRGDRFDRVEAEVAAKSLRDQPFESYVLLGMNVAKAFGVNANEWLAVVEETDSKRFLIFPHPSGINRWWNDALNRDAARKALRSFLNINRST